METHAYYTRKMQTNEIVAALVHEACHTRVTGRMSLSLCGLFAISTDMEIISLLLKSSFMCPEWFCQYLSAVNNLIVYMCCDKCIVFHF